jgi:hypothetical protein
VLALALSDTDLAAIGGIGTFVLAAVALLQIGQSRRRALAEQAAMRDSIQASIAQGDAVREAARAQVQPIVFASVVDGVVRGRDEGHDLDEGELGFPYRLSNEGTGVALNIKHGVEVAGIEKAFGDGMEVRSLAPGETLPPLVGMDIPRPLVAVFREDELPEQWAAASRTYWVRFENVFGDTFETRNPLDPLQSAAFMRVTEIPVPNQPALTPQSSSTLPAGSAQPAEAQRRWNGSTTVGAITATAAIFGAAVGGFATYVGNNKLQKSQDRTAARGAGRVLQADFVDAATRIQVELARKRFITPEARSVASVSEEDEKLIASNVSASTWDHIASAKSVVQTELAVLNSSAREVLEARDHLPVALTGARLRFEESSLQTLSGAIFALKELTGTESAE